MAKRRNKQYEDEDALMKAIDGYFASISRTVTAVERCETGEKEGGKKVVEERTITNDGGKPIQYREYVVPPTIWGLCEYLGISVAVWERYGDPRQDPYFPEATARAVAYLREWNERELLTRKDVRGLIYHLQNTGIWIEEASELDEGDFNQLDIRLRTDFPHYLQMILSFNPISITHWLKKRFFDRADPRATTHRSTYKDNRFLTPEAVATLEAFQDTDEYYYQVYCLGQWGVTGKTVFDGKAITRRLAEIPGPTERGLFVYDLCADGVHIENIRWEADKNGPVWLYQPPEPGRPYVIGGDTAGEGSDWFTGQVLDNVTGQQVCALRCRFDEDVYARQMYCLGMHYGEALIGIEVNFSTYPVKLLELMGYRRLYVREVEDNYTGAIRSSFGFKTTMVTRPVIIAGLVQAMREGIRLVSDEVTLQEMLTFVRNDELRPEAEQGAHDDTVMALAIAWYIRPQQRTSLLRAEEAPKVRWTADMWEDYYAAGEDERKYLRKKWGEPGI